jgi:hypothetical protein
VGDSGQGGPVRLAILLCSILGLVVIGIKSTGGASGAPSGGAGQGRPGIILAVPVRGAIPSLASQRLAALPSKRGAAAVDVGGATYLLGGTQRTARGTKPVGSVIRKAGNQPPTRVAKLPTPVTDAAAAAVGDRLYAIGGRLSDGNPSNEIQEYDIATEHSVIAARLPVPVSNSAAIAMDGYVYLLGGQTSAGPSATVYRFSPWVDAVAPGGRLLQPLSGGRAVTVRPHSGFLVGASGPGSSGVAYSLLLKPLH